MLKIILKILQNPLKLSKLREIDKLYNIFLSCFMTLRHEET